MDEEQTHEEKSEVKTNLVTNEGIRVPCAPNQRKIPLFYMRLRKLEILHEIKEIRDTNI